MAEHWKQLTDFTDFWISDHGNMRNMRTGREFNGYMFAKERARTTLRQDGKTKTVYIHRLVAQYFCKDWFEGCVVHHLDEDPSNNHYKNLMCLTSSQHSRLHNQGKSKHEVLLSVDADEVYLIPKGSKERLHYNNAIEASEDLGIASKKILFYGRHKIALQIGTFYFPKLDNEKNK